MKNKYPNTTSYSWVSRLKDWKFSSVFIVLIIAYIAIILFFSILHYIFTTLRCHPTFFDYTYFSFVTSATIGFGDYYPVTTFGKFLTIMQSVVSTIYFALMISVLSVKMFYPSKTIVFSQKIIYDPESGNGKYFFRILNTNREALINPEIRINVVEHKSEGNVIARYCHVPLNYQIAYHGKHDFTYSFHNNVNGFDIFQMKLEADEYNHSMRRKVSRFRIVISISGSYGMQQTSILKRYYADEIIIGKHFKAISYNEEDQRRGGEIRYSKYPNFWRDFETVIK